MRVEGERDASANRAAASKNRYGVCATLLISAWDVNVLRVGGHAAGSFGKAVW